MGLYEKFIKKNAGTLCSIADWNSKQASAANPCEIENDAVNFIDT